MKRFASVILLTIIAMSATIESSRADWTATGAWYYIDREYDQSGFTGAELPKPIREADVEVVDINQNKNNGVIASGVTDPNGRFSIVVQDNKVRDIQVRVVARSDYTATLNMDVRANESGKAQYYASVTPVIQDHAPSVNVDTGPATVPVGQGGEPFNVYDQMLRGADYLAHLTGSRPGPDKHLSTVWAPDNGVAGAFYSVSSRMIILRDTAGYDDTVVLHEMGHFAIREYSATSSFGGTHTFAMCFLDTRLAFDEGWASYWGNSALRHAGIPQCNVYMRSNGGPGAGNLVRWADLEDDQQYLCEGSTSEVNVFTVLWDIVDGPGTPDTTPGVDDAHDLLDMDEAEVWEVMTDYVPTASSITLEDFWDGWFLPPVQNGFLAEMIAIAGHVAVEYFEDGLEPNDSAAAAADVGGISHGSLFSDQDADGAGSPDLDYYWFLADAGKPYILETLNLRSGVDTRLDLYDTDGQTLLALNDDRSPGDDSSRINWVAPGTGTYYVRVSELSSITDYGSYDVSVAEGVPVDNDGDGYDPPVDCNDDNSAINPGAVELCDGLDNTCNGVVDEGYDLDGDLFRTCDGDCNDSDPAINPAAEEVPNNNRDDNCNGLVDETVNGGDDPRRDRILRRGE